MKPPQPFFPHTGDQMMRQLLAQQKLGQRQNDTMYSLLKKQNAMAPTSWLATTFLHLNNELLRVVLGGFHGHVVVSLFSFDYLLYLLT